MGLPELILLVIGSAAVLWFSWQTVRLSLWHALPRLFAFCAVLALGALNLRAWFARPLAWNQLISWALLTGSLLLVLHAVRLLRRVGKPHPAGFEATTCLVTSGAYRFIRHPMYSSLLLLAWGVFFKVPASPAGLALVLTASLCLYLTARVEERENLRRFGEDYRDYMRVSKMFIPFLF